VDEPPTRQLGVPLVPFQADVQVFTDASLDGWGSSPGRPGSLRSLGVRREAASHQHSGAEGRNESLSGIQGSNHEQVHPNSDRQYDGSGVYKPPRRDKISESTQGDPGFLRSSSEAEDDSESSTCTRQVKSTSRPTLEKTSDSTLRMVSPPSSMGEPVEQVVETACGSLRHKTERQTVLLREPSTGRLSFGRRRAINGLEEYVCICLSSDGSDFEGFEQTEDDEELYDDSDSAVLTRETLVPGTDADVQGASDPVTTPTESVETVTQQRVPPEPSNLQLTRVEVIQQALIKKGFTATVAMQISKPVTQSSAKVYESKWHIFCTWCKDMNIELKDVHISHICDFLQDLFDYDKA
jgi:hypothetical protein